MTITITQKVIKFNKLFAIVTEYYTKKYKNGELEHGKYFDIISDIILNPTQVILYANQMLEEQEKVEKCIDKGECPNCGSVIEIESEELGYGFQIFGFSCTSCNWRSE